MKPDVTAREQTPLEVLLDHVESLWYDNMRYRLGRVLTVIDAAVADQEQRKAVKDIIHQCFGWGNIKQKDYYLGELKERVKAFNEGRKPSGDEIGLQNE